MSTSTGADAPDLTVLPVREGHYGDRVVAVEPGGIEAVPPGERHGRPISLFWTWMSPNLEFATVFVGVLAVSVFGLSFWPAVLALLVGNLLGSLTHAVLSARGPLFGVPQMILSRIGFGQRGNLLPAGLNAVTAGIGWFAVNSVSGALALNTLTHLPQPLCLVIIVLAQIVIAFFGHNFVHAFERYAFPLLAVAFVLASIWTLAKSSPSGGHGSFSTGPFLLTLGTAFGYAVGWNPYASDYTRYLPRNVDRARVGLLAGLGVLVSCTVLEVVGAASVTIAGAATSANPTANFTGNLPTVIADLTLLAIALGAVSANVLNIYSGAMSFLALGITLPLSLRRAIVAVVFGGIGFVVALNGLHNAAESYENFLLIIAYWIAPWLAVVFTDQLLRRRQEVSGLLFAPWHRPWAGVVAMAAGMGLSIWLFSNQTEYVGPVAKAYPSIGDITFFVGFLVSAAVYAGLYTVESRRDRTIVLPAAGRRG